MKLETFKFEKEHDLAIFKALKRLAKDVSLFDSRFLDILRRKNNILVVALIIAIFIFAVFAASILVHPFDKITGVIDSVDAGFEVTGVKIPDYTETEAIMEAFNLS